MIKIKSILALLRVSHWSKNLFIFLPLFFAQRLTHLESIETLIFISLGFSFLASSVYIFNDLIDIESDKLHPVKRFRPIAAGIFSKTQSYISIIILLIIGFGLIHFKDETGSIKVLVIIYLIQNILYTFMLKHISILDVTIVSIGFVIRVFIGGISIGVDLSQWIILMTFILAMFLAFAKRRDDVKLLELSNTIVRRSTNGYNLVFLNQTLGIMGAIIIVTYLMYCTSPEVMMRFGQYTYLTSFFVIVGIFRYLQITLVFNESGNPTKIFLEDRFLQTVIVGWFLSLILIMYLQ